MTDRSPIEFWFDFGSGYAYFVALQIEELAARHGRCVRWRPFMLGAAFQKTGARGLSSTPLKRDYARRDWQRIARLLNVPFAPPPDHPQVALTATRLFYAVEEQRVDDAPRFARAVFDGYYSGVTSLSDVRPLLELMRDLGLDDQRAAGRIANPQFKQVVRDIGEGAVSTGIFGSPWLIADGEPFWGWDRLALLDEWLSRGGW